MDTLTCASSSCRKLGTDYFRGDHPAAPFTKIGMSKRGGEWALKIAICDLKHSTALRSQIASSSLGQRGLERLTV